MIPDRTTHKMHAVRTNNNKSKKMGRDHIIIDQTITKANFDELVRQHQMDLESFLYRFTASKEVTEDLAQETLMKAFQKFDTFKGKSSFGTWLFSIAANLAKDHLRAKKRWTIYAQDNCKSLIGSTKKLSMELREINAISENGKYEIHEHIDFCFTCIAKTLILEQQLALMLADIYDFKVKEISEILGITSGIVKHLLHSARRTMQDIFEHRCALINKQGICHQCSELNGFNNSKAETQRKVAELELVKASQNPDKEILFLMRTEIVKSIDPLNSKGTDLHDFLLQCTHKANSYG